MQKKYEVINYVDFDTKPNILEVWAENVSDGYHTMEELYRHRYVLFIALCKIYDNYITPLQSRVKCWKSKFHFDGSMYEGSFILGMTITTLTGVEQISYHIPLEYWDKVNVIEMVFAPEWDGHTPNDVLERLMRL